MAGKIRVGIWGLGRAGNGMHIHELGLYPDMFEIVAGCDWDPARREAAAKKLPGRPVYEKGEELLKDPNVELVSVATRSPDHVKHAIQAVEAGKMVMVEKPMACRIEDALELQKVADANPGKVFVRHNRRFEAAFSHIREIIKSGKLGHIFEIKLCRHNYQWRADWQTILDCGGGQLLNWGPHLVDHALQFLECPVKELWSDLAIVASRGDAEDHVKIVFKGENGRVVDVEISGGASLGDPVYAVRGSRGTLMSWDEKRLKLKYLAPAIRSATLPLRPTTRRSKADSAARSARSGSKTISASPRRTATSRRRSGDICTRRSAAVNRIRSRWPRPSKWSGSSTGSKRRRFATSVNDKETEP